MTEQRTKAEPHRNSRDKRNSSIVKQNMKLVSVDGYPLDICCTIQCMKQLAKCLMTNANVSGTVYGE
jgi:hypothetical protein